MTPPRKNQNKSGKKASGARNLGVRVRTAKGRKTSSTRWLERQLNDPYVQAAKRDGFRSRAAYKLLEIDEKHNLLRPGLTVVDLGAAPGGWTQVAVEKVASQTGDGVVVGLDIQEMDPIPGATMLKADFMEDQGLTSLQQTLDGRQVDLVLSDMAAPSTGHRQTDHLRIMGLCEAALEFAEDVLAPGGCFLAKVLQGGTENTLLTRMKKRFNSVHHVKPDASRSDSSELYVLAKEFDPDR